MAISVEFWRARTHVAGQLDLAAQIFCKVPPLHRRQVTRGAKVQVFSIDEHSYFRGAVPSRLACTGAAIPHYDMLLDMCIVRQTPVTALL